MLSEKPLPIRFIGLDIHKHYLIAISVDEQLNQVLGPQRVQLSNLEGWIHKNLTLGDAVVLEMTTNTWQVYDELLPHVHSVTVVHPPHVALITRSQVMTDKIAASHLARLHAKGLLTGIWIPPQEVRDRRALCAQRRKMTRLATQAKNRLHAVLHRHHLLPPAGKLFSPDKLAWWQSLSLTPLEKAMLQTDLDTLAFAQSQIASLEQAMLSLAALDERIPLLIQMPGISLVNAMTILAAIGDIRRFPEAKQLVGYAGLGARIHDSGLTTRSGRITKAGRKDLRAALVEAAQTAANTHPHWQAELTRLEPRLGRNKAIVAIARKLLVAVWHVLTFQAADRFAIPERVANKLKTYSDRLRLERRSAGQSTAAFVRTQLDRLGMGAQVTQLDRGKLKSPLRLPPSTLRPAGDG
jgi:transposase